MAGKWFSNFKLDIDKILESDYFVAGVLGENEKFPKCYFKLTKKEPLLFASKSRNKTTILREQVGKQPEVEIQVYDVYPVRV